MTSLAPGEGSVPARPRVRADLALLPGYHSPQIEVDVRLNTNESPLPPPAAWNDALVEAVRAMVPNRYPDREALGLRERIAAMHGVDVGNVFCANGSNEVIQTLLLAFGGPGRRALMFEPTYALHSHISRITGTDVVVEQRDTDFLIPVPALASAAPEADVVFLCSPNNPTGVIDGVDVLDAALAHGGCHRDGGAAVVVVDEAYGQFASRSAAERLDEDVPLVVLRTFSKTWALAGLRLGYALGPTWLVDELWKVSLPYHLSLLTQAAGVAALDHDDEMDERVAGLVAERERVAAALADLPLRAWPSESNFILFRPDDRGPSGPVVWQRLLDRSVLIRNCSTWPRLDGCLRVTIGTPSENDRFIEALQEAIRS